MKKSNMMMNIEIEDSFIMKIIHEVFDKYQYNQKFDDPDEIKETILKDFKERYNDKKIIAKGKYNFNMRNYISMSIRCSVTSLLWRIKKAKANTLYL